MSGRTSRLLVLAFALLGAGLVVAQTTVPVAPNERHVKPEVNVQDGNASRNAKLWVLDFKFKGPRITKVNIPGRGERVVWYLWYQVYNNTGQQVTFIPDFELVTHGDKQVMTYRDQILPAAQEAIAKIEDPTGFYKIKNSVTISSNPIPPTLPKADPKPVTGVAIWIDDNEIGPDDDAATKEKKKKLPKLAESNHYSIFVAGLSNGWSLSDPVGDEKDPVVRRKTLQLTFNRVGDQYYMKSDEIRFKSSEWIYRASKLKLNLPLLDEKAKKDKDEKDKGKGKDD
jgi:hypothetical protein